MKEPERLFPTLERKTSANCMIYALLKTDQEKLSQVPPGETPPPPMLYDPEVHRKHQEGHYHSLKPGTQPRKILQLPKKM